jgi:hypothetical protein
VVSSLGLPLTLNSCDWKNAKMSMTKEGIKKLTMFKGSSAFSSSVNVLRCANRLHNKSHFSGENVRKLHIICTRSLVRGEPSNDDS